jgi:hypothetical protein
MEKKPLWSGAGPALGASGGKLAVSGKAYVVTTQAPQKTAFDLQAEQSKWSAAPLLVHLRICCQ